MSWTSISVIRIPGIVSLKLAGTWDHFFCQLMATLTFGQLVSFKYVCCVAVKQLTPGLWIVWLKAFLRSNNPPGVLGQGLWLQHASQWSVFLTLEFWFLRWFFCWVMPLPTFGQRVNFTFACGHAVIIMRLTPVLWTFWLTALLKFNN